MGNSTDLVTVEVYYFIHVSTSVVCLHYPNYPTWLYAVSQQLLTITGAGAYRCFKGTLASLLPRVKCGIYTGFDCQSKAYIMEDIQMTAYPNTQATQALDKTRIANQTLSFSHTDKKLHPNEFEQVSWWYHHLHHLHHQLLNASSNKDKAPNRMSRI